MSRRRPLPITERALGFKDPGPPTRLERLLLDALRIRGDITARDIVTENRRRARSRRHE